MARIKPKDKLPQLQSWDEVDLALCEIAEHTRVIETSLDKGTQRKTTENELPSLTQCTA